MTFLDKLIGASVNYLLQKNVIDEDDRDVYEYGFHALYNNIIDIASIAVISILLKRVPDTVLYHVSFIVLRNIAGGYHAKTHLRCFIISTAIWLLSLWAITYTVSPMICIGLAGISVLLIWTKAPVEHANSPLSVEKRKRMKRYSRIFSAFFFAGIIFISVAMDITHLWIAATLAYGMASHTVLILLALLQAHREKRTQPH